MMAFFEILGLMLLFYGIIAVLMVSGIAVFALLDKHIDRLAYKLGVMHNEF